MKSKKGQMGASVWLMSVFIYFIFFTLIVYSAENIELESSTTGVPVVELADMEFNGFIGQTYCNNPRSYFNPVTKEQDFYSNKERDRLFCEESSGALSLDNCNEISGCNWEEYSTGFWFFATTTEGCVGDINSTEYGIEKNNPLFGRPRVVPHNNTNLWQQYTPFADASICTHPNVFQNKSLCNMFSCSWESITPESNFKSAGNLYSSIADVFTFRYDFGFTNSTISFILNVIFVILPLMILILSVYYIFHPVK